MKNLVLVSKYCARECSAEHFYRKRIMIYCGADIHGYLDTQRGDSYKKAYRNLSLSFYDKERYYDLGPEDLWYTFDQSCRFGYLPIVEKMITQKEIDLSDNDNFEDVICDITKLKRWNVLDALFKHGLDLEYYRWDLMYYMSREGDIEGLKRWMPKLGNLKHPGSPALRAAAREGPVLKIWALFG